MWPSFRNSLLAKLPGKKKVEYAELDSTTHLLGTIGSGHVHLHEGEAFSITDVENLNTGIENWLIETPSNGSNIHIIIDVEGTGEIRFDLYEGADRNGVTPLNVVNPNRIATNSSNVLVYKNITGGSTDGDLLFSKRSGASRASGTVMPGANRGVNEWVLKPGTKYIIKAETFADIYVSIQLDWYEYEHKN